MPWKIYYYIVLILTVLGLVLTYNNLAYFNIGGVIEILGSVFSLIGLHSYVYKKPIWTPKFWRLFFYFIVGNWLLAIAYAFTPINDLVRIPDLLVTPTVTTPEELIIGMLFSSPILFAICHLGKETKVKTATKPKETKKVETKVKTKAKPKKKSK